jgi:L-asparaginase
VSVKKIAILATGGTIAGTASDGSDTLGYTAAQLGIEELLASVPALKTVPLLTEQVAQIDSKDMSFQIWRELALRCEHWLAQPEVGGLVISHGTDTLEETAFFLHAVLTLAKPVVLTCAMRPATALAPDGPQNLVDAVMVASHPEAHGVVVVCDGTIHGALDVSKQHTTRVDTFSSGDAGPIGYVEHGRLRLSRDWPAPYRSSPFPLPRLPAQEPWPRVEIVMSHAGADGAVVQALRTAGVDGLVAAATGNGTLHSELEAALLEAQAAGVSVLRATRCTRGGIVELPGDPLPAAGALSPVKGRIALLLQLLEQRA